MVVGTLAIDYIGSYESTFELLDKSANLNVSLSLDGLEESFGGCAMNIAVGLTRLGHEVKPFALVGAAVSQQYMTHLNTLGISTEGIVSLPEYTLSSHCIIVTDKDDNQFTAFYPGPSRSEKYAALLTDFVQANRSFADIIILAPDIGVNMLKGMELCQDIGVPFISDPGQCLHDFTVPQTKTLVNGSQILAVNQYEFNLLDQRTNTLDQVPVVVKTMGTRGVSYRAGSDAGEVAAVKPLRIVDPTGCGDAFRVGLTHGRTLGYSWEDSCKLAVTLASIAIEYQGTQTYSIDDYEERVKSMFDLTIQNNPLI